MQYFTDTEFDEKYTDYATMTHNVWEIEAACEMIYSQIGLLKRQDWDNETVPDAIKRASMEQYRFMLDHDIPFVDFNKQLSAGGMNVNLNSDYSTLALRILYNAGYGYRGIPLTTNMGVDIGFGG